MTEKIQIIGFLIAFVFCGCQQRQHNPGDEGMHVSNPGVIPLVGPAKSTKKKCKFYYGQIVRLKSDGPKMTVNKIYDQQDCLVETSWFDDSGKKQDAMFNQSSLKPVK